jgi:lipopolysaccharide/colanic/teichoic acid biosynthesis glycosyltransferase
MDGEGFGLKSLWDKQDMTTQLQTYEIYRRPTYRLLKRIFDIVFACLGFLALLPFFTAIAVAVKLSSPGPIFYRGLRTGRFSKPFRIFKFRSMVVGADKGAGTTSRNDPRVTAVGRFIRRYKLDELPQLLNVLVGDMSFVGPRPELPRYTDQYQGEELLILQVRPGITDYSSLKFSNLNDLIGDEDPDQAYEEKILAEKNRLRIQYVKDQSFWLDLSLILKTILRVVVRA